MKILFWDLETEPHLVWDWTLFPRGPHPLARVKQYGGVMCGAWKWRGHKKVTFASKFEDSFLEDVWNVLDEADAVVSWNGKNFDTRQMNRAFLLAGMAPPSPYKEIDLMRAAKKRMYFPSNKLEHVARALGVGVKYANEMEFQDWIDFIDGDEKAYKKFKRYNVQDVALLEPLYERLLPWVDGHPNVNLYDGTEGCPKCGSTHVQKRGFRTTSISTFQQYQCQECRGWFHDGTRQQASTYRSAS